MNNVGGVGKQTLNGIELINVSGDSNGTFKQEGRIVAGAYDYRLKRGAGANANNWYLTSRLSQSKDDGGRGGTDNSGVIDDHPEEPLHRQSSGET